MKKSDFWTVIERFPPILIRLLARHPRGRPLTTLEIAERSQLPPYLVETISLSLTWDGIDLPSFKKFTIACNLDLTKYSQRKRAQNYLMAAMGNKYRYLKMDPAWESYYHPLMIRFLNKFSAYPIISSK